MVEATTGVRLDPTSILDVYKVFWHLDMLCMGIWVWDHPYRYIPLQVAGVFWVLGVTGFHPVRDKKVEKIRLWY